MRTKMTRLMALILPLGLWAIMLSSCGVKDSSISAAIAEKTQTTPELAGINATVKDGVVTLAGQFKDEASRTAAENAVKEIKGVKSVVNNGSITPPPPAPAPVVISADDELNKGVTDAIKDFPTVKASVKDGVVTLTGNIRRANLQKLIMSLHTLKPKKIDNQLTIK